MIFDLAASGLEIQVLYDISSIQSGIDVFLGVSSVSSKSGNSSSLAPQTADKRPLLQSSLGQYSNFE
jgi:hypothetical protein